MKGLVKWLIIFLVICGSASIISAGLGGYIYFNETKDISDSGRKELNENALKSLHIESDIPVEFQITQGKPYVEYSQSYVSLLGPIYECQLDVKEEKTGTYIKLDRKSNRELQLGYQLNEAKLVVYLTKQDLELLEIKGEKNHYMPYAASDSLNLEGFNINTVDITANYTAIELDGMFQKIRIDGSDYISIHSNQSATLSLSNICSYDIKGKYKDIEIDGDCVQGTIDAMVDNNVKINNIESADLTGKYQHIELNGAQVYSINIDSDTPYSVDANINDSKELKLKGALKECTLEGDVENLSISLETVADRLRLLGNYYGDAQIILPSNITGFNILTHNDEEYRESVYDATSMIDTDEDDATIVEQADDSNQPISDFKLKKNSEYEYTYKDGKMQIELNKSNSGRLRIINGGYQTGIK